MDQPSHDPASDSNYSDQSESLCIQLVDCETTSSNPTSLSDDQRAASSSSGGKSSSWASTLHSSLHSLKNTLTTYRQRAHLAYLNKHLSTLQSNQTGISRYTTIASMYAHDAISATLSGISDAA